MQSFFAVKNNTKFPAITVEIDGERIFYDILKGDTSDFAVLPAGSITVLVYNNLEKLILNIWVSLPPKKRLVISVTENGFDII